MILLECRKMGLLWEGLVGRRWVDVVDDDDGKGSFLVDEIEAGVVGGVDECAAALVVEASVKRGCRKTVDGIHQRDVVGSGRPVSSTSCLVLEHVHDEAEELRNSGTGELQGGIAALLVADHVTLQVVVWGRWEWGADLWDRV